VDKELQRASESKQELINWLGLDYTKKIRGQWRKELRAAQATLDTLRPENFKDYVLYLSEIARIQEGIRLRKSLVEAPETALLVKEKTIENLKGMAEEHQ
jgi:hypothetical protein